MRNEQVVDAWLKRARSNLAKARLGRTSDDILYEDLCFECQQAVEKSLKTLLVNQGVAFPWAHLIARLLEELASHEIEIPAGIKESVVLTEYAVMTRYPGDYEPLDEADYREALAIAENVMMWVNSSIEHPTENV